MNRLMRKIREQLYTKRQLSLEEMKLTPEHVDELRSEFNTLACIAKMGQLTPKQRARFKYLLWKIDDVETLPYEYMPRGILKHLLKPFYHYYS